jgi:hypothetical protein
MDEREKLYSETRQDLLKRQLSNAENFDKAILSLSTAGLGYSLVFIKDIIPLSKAAYLIFLHISWILFGSAIMSTIASYISSQRGIIRQLKFAEEYYLGRKDEYLTKKNWPALVTIWLNNIAGIVFIGAICFTITFVSLNIGGGTDMGAEKEDRQVPLREGAPVPTMQKVQGSGEEHGAPIPNMQPIRQSASTSASSNQGSEGSQGDSAAAQSSGNPSEASGGSDSK